MPRFMPARASGDVQARGGGGCLGGACYADGVGAVGDRYGYGGYCLLGQLDRVGHEALTALVGDDVSGGVPVDFEEVVADKAGEVEERPLVCAGQHAHPVAGGSAQREQCFLVSELRLEQPDLFSGPSVSFACFLAAAMSGRSPGCCTGVGDGPAGVTAAGMAIDDEIEDVPISRVVGWAVQKIQRSPSK